MTTTGGSEQEPIDLASVERFIRRAYSARVVDRETALRLLNLARTMGAPSPAPPPGPVAVPAAVIARATATLQDASDLSAEPAVSRLGPELAAEMTRRMAALRHALGHGDSAAVKSSEAHLAALLTAARGSLAALVSPAQAAPAVPRPPAAVPVGPRPPIPAAPRRPAGPTWSQRVGRRLSALRRAVTADFAIHGITYLGVLLALVVLVVFFAVDDYFGRTFEIPWTRPFIFVIFPAFFFVLAWVLRNKSGIPQAAVAIELIGAVLVPAMVAALFRDGYSIPPNVEQLGRWVMYAGSALPALAVFWWLARRRRLYAYLIAPTVWTMAGALGLYLHFHWIPKGPDMDRAMPEGMSAYQVILILATMAVTVLVATLMRRTSLGRLVSAPTVRAAVALAPFVLVVAAQFAYSDAVLEGPPGIGPGIEQMEAPLALAAAAAAAVFLAARWARFAWEGLPARMARDLPGTAAVFAGIAAAAAVGLGCSRLMPLPWVGVVLCGAGAGLAALEHLPGFGSRVGAWTGAAAAAGGLAIALGSGGATTAAWGTAALAVAVFPSGLRILFRTAPASDFVTRGLLGITTLVALGAGAARLAWPAGSAWVLVGAAALLAGIRRVPALAARARSLSGVPAAILVAAGLAVAVARAALGSGPGFAVSGALVLAAALAVFLLDFPWIWRFIPGIALLVAGGLVEVRPALEAGAWAGAAADAGILGGLGLALVADAVFRRSGRYRVWHSAVGHCLVLAAAGRGVGDERSALAGLGILFAAHALEAAAVESGRSALFSRLAAVETVPPALAALPASVATVALPVIAVLAARQIPSVAAEDPRRGLVLAVTALGIAGASLLWRRRPRVRVVTGATATAVAVAGVAFAAPSATGLLTATGAAVLSTAAVAVGCRLPWAVSLPWAAAAATLVLGLWRAGVAPLDLRYGILGAGTALAAGPALVNWRRGRPAPALGPWLWPPSVLGLGLLAAAIGLGLEQSRLLAVIAFVAAAAVAFAGWSTRLGGASLPVAAAVAIGYAHLLQGSWPVFSDGVRWMPLAGALVLAAAALPGRRHWRVAVDPSPGTLLTGLVIAALGVSVGGAQGEAAPALLCTAGVLAVVWAARRSAGWLWAALLCALVAGLVAAPEWWWLAATAAADALVIGTLAVRRADSDEGRILAWTAAGLAAVAFGALTEWGAWETVPLLAATAAAASASLAGATVLGMPRAWPPGLALWQLPTVALAAGAGLTLAVSGHARIGGDALGIDAALLAGAALASGLVGARRLWPALVGGSAALAAAAYGCLAGWLDWEPATVVGVTAAAGAAAAAGGAWLSLRSTAGERWALWNWPLHALAQAAAVTVAGVALAEFAAPPALGVVSGVLAAEAVLCGLIGTVRRGAGLVGLSAVFTAGAYGCLAGSLQWAAATVLGVTAVAGVVFAGSAAGLSYWTTAPARVALWRLPAHGLGQVAAVAVAGIALAEYGTPGGLGVVAAVLFAEAGLCGVVGTVERWPLLVGLSALFAAGAYGCLAGWLEWGTDLVVGVTAGTAGLLAASATLLEGRVTAATRAGLWRRPLHGLAEAAVAGAGFAGATGYAPAGALAVVASACAFEAAYIAANVRWVPPAASPRYLSAEFATAAVFLGLAAVGHSEMAAGPWVQGAAALALVAAIGYGLAGGESPWRQPLAVFAGLVAPGAAVAATWMIGAPYGHTAAAVAFGGAGLVAIGLLTRRLMFLEGGLVAWLGAGLIAFHQRLDFTSHLTVVPVAVALLAVVEVERGRRRREGREPSAALLRILEWALMLAPPALCVVDASAALWYLGPMAAEGAVLMAWGILSEVRRRALLGVAVLALTIVLAAVIPLSRGMREGLGGEQWLAVGAGAAVVLIALGSTLERQRRRIGRALAAAGRAMEGWE